jgi:hypothetical protein
MDMEITSSKAMGPSSPHTDNSTVSLELQEARQKAIAV